jgi:hypothetical protein
MSMPFKYVPYKYSMPVTGSLGAGAGLAVSELATEYATRLLGYTSYAKATVKTLGKIAIGTLTLGASAKWAKSPDWKFFYQASALAGMGSSLLDWIAAYYPGGIPGIATRLAVTSRVMTVGTRTVTATLARVTPTPAMPTRVAPSAPSVGRY